MKNINLNELTNFIEKAKNDKTLKVLHFILIKSQT
jgi:hypothetical protein